MGMGSMVKAAGDTLKGRRKPEEGKKREKREGQAHDSAENMPTRIKRPMVRGR